MPRGIPNTSGNARVAAPRVATAPIQATGLPGLPVAGIPPVERPPEPLADVDLAAVVETDATRFWPITDSSPIPNTTDRFKPAGPVDLLVAGVVVPGVRWGMYSTTNGGRVWAWIAPDGRSWPQMEPEGWRLPLAGRKTAIPSAA